jgi:hypothetical protein
LCEVDAFAAAVFVVNAAQDSGIVATADTGIDTNPIAFADTLRNVVGVSVIAALDKLGEAVAAAGVFLSLLAIDEALLANRFLRGIFAVDESNDDASDVDACCITLGKAGNCSGGGGGAGIRDGAGIRGGGGGCRICGIGSSSAIDKASQGSSELFCTFGNADSKPMTSGLLSVGWWFSKIPTSAHTFPRRLFGGVDSELLSLPSYKIFHNALIDALNTLNRRI